MIIWSTKSLNVFCNILRENRFYRKLKEIKLTFLRKTTVQHFYFLFIISAKILKKKFGANSEVVFLSPGFLSQARSRSVAPNATSVLLRSVSWWLSAGCTMERRSRTRVSAAASSSLHHPTTKYTSGTQTHIITYNHLFVFTVGPNCLPYLC